MMFETLAHATIEDQNIAACDVNVEASLDVSDLLTETPEETIVVIPAIIRSEFTQAQLDYRQARRVFKIGEMEAYHSRSRVESARARGRIGLLR